MRVPKINFKEHKFGKKPILPALTDFSDYKRLKMTDKQYETYMKKR